MLTFPFSLNNLLNCPVYCSKRASAEWAPKIEANRLFDKDLLMRDADVRRTTMAQHPRRRATQQCAFAPNAGVSHRHGAASRALPGTS
jgi:hypothetical protein